MFLQEGRTDNTVAKGKSTTNDLQSITHKPKDIEYQRMSENCFLGIK